jgi:hypothetical protein
MGHPKQPARQRLPLSDRPRLSRQDKESGLERILAFVHSSEHSPAHAQDHSAVALHQGRKGGLVPRPGKAFQQWFVCQLLGPPRSQHLVQMIENRLSGAMAHDTILLDRMAFLL